MATYHLENKRYILKPLECSSIDIFTAKNILQFILRRKINTWKKKFYKFQKSEKQLLTNLVIFI